MATPTAASNAAVRLGDCSGKTPADMTKACLTWEADASATSAEVVVIPGFTHYSLSTDPADVVAGQNRPTRSIVIENLASDTAYRFELVNISADGKGPPAVLSLRTPPGVASPWWKYSSAMFLLLLAAGAALCGAGALWWYQDAGQRIAWYSCALALAVLLVGFLTPALTGGTFGVWQIVIGKDKRVSTSKTQVFLWTLLVGFILVYFTSRTWFGKTPHLFDGFVPGGKSSGTGSAWPDYLVLLGGPFAGLVIAKTAVGLKSDSGNAQKTAADDAGTNIAQVVTDDNGDPDLIDTQYFLFNLAALTYVIVGLATTNALPQIPGLILALTSASAAGYAANKTVTQNKPTIKNLTPLSARPGQPITISGTNFVPAGTVTPPAVTIGNAPAMVEAGASDSQIVAAIPVGAATGTTAVVVTTSSGATSDPQSITVGPDTAQTRSVSPPLAGPGETINIDGTGFYSEIDGSYKCTVMFGNAGGAPPVTATITRLANGLDRATTQVPGAVSRGAVIEIAVATFRGITTPAQPYLVGV